MYLYTRRFNYVKLRDIYLTETIEAAQDLRSLLDQIEQGLKDNAEYIAKHGNPSIYEGDLIPGNFSNTGPWFSNEVIQKVYNETLEPDGIDAEDYSIKHYMIDEKGVSYYVRRSDQTVDDIKPAPTITVGEWVIYRTEDNAIANLYTPIEELDELLMRHSKREFIPHDMQSYPVPGKDYSTAVKVDHNDVILPSEIQRVARMAMDNDDTTPIRQKPKLSLVPDPKTEDVVDSLPDVGPNFPVQKQDIKNIQSVIDKRTPDIVPFDNKALVNTAKAKFPDATPGMQKNCEVISSMVAKKYGLQNPKPIIVFHEKRSGIGMCYHDYNGEGSYPQKGRGQVTINWQANIIDRVAYDYFDEKGNRKVINVTGSMNGKDIHTLKENDVVEAKSSPGRVKRAGASCKGSATELRKKAKKYSGEKGKMYHWCANMKSGKKKKS